MYFSRGYLPSNLFAYMVRPTLRFPDQLWGWIEGQTGVDLSEDQVELELKSETS